MAHQHYRTKAIFLKKEDKGEADQLFTVFTEDFGKLEILGRAIRKIKSKLRAGTELFYLSEIEFIQGKTYKTLTDAILIDKFKSLRENPQKLEIAYQIADALDVLMGGEAIDEKIWQLLSEVFQRLNSDTQSLNHSITQSLYYYFLWNIFSTLGYAPELHSCPVCQKKLLPETFYFMPEEGGVVCWQCFSNLKKERNNKDKNSHNKTVQSDDFVMLAKEIHPHTTTRADSDKFVVKGDMPLLGVGVNVDTVKILRVFLSQPIEIIERLRIDEAEKENLKDISELYLSFLKDVLNPQAR